MIPDRVTIALLAKMATRIYCQARNENPNVSPEAAADAAERILKKIESNVYAAAARGEEETRRKQQEPKHG